MQKSTHITFHRGNKKVCLQIDHFGFESIQKRLSQEFGEDVTTLDMAYIDIDRDYIAVKDQQEWEIYLEDLNAGELDPATSGDFYIFNTIDSLAQFAVEDSINGSLTQSFASVRNENVEVMADQEVISQIVEEISMKSYIMTPDIRSRMEALEPSKNATEEKKLFQSRVDEEVKRIIEQKVLSGELQVTKNEEKDFCGFRLILKKLGEKREKDAKKFRKIQRKGVKAFQKQITRIEKIGKGIFKGMKKALNI